MEKIYLAIGLMIIILFIFIIVFFIRSNKVMQQKLIELSNKDDNSAAKADQLETVKPQISENKSQIDPVKLDTEPAAEEKQPAVSPVINLNNIDNMTEAKIKTVTEISNKGVNQIDPNRFQVDKPDNTQTLDIVIGEQLINKSLENGERV